MPTTLIQQKPAFDKKVEGEDKLAIAELFCDTLQGEGVNTGVPSTFMRLQGCTLQCTWCDTLDVWPHGNEYSFDEIFTHFEKVDLINRFNKGQHLVLTGGSPLKQETRLIAFLHAFYNKYNFLPYTEVENECVLMPSGAFRVLVDCWNNSPKLANSGMKVKARIKEDVLKVVAAQKNSWFKFVVQQESDWKEIKETFIIPGYINRDQIILMPEGQTQDELAITREIAADMAIKHGVRFTDRMHITIWNKKTGV